MREHLRSESTVYAEIREQKDLRTSSPRSLHAELKKVADRFAPSATDEA